MCQAVLSPNLTGKFQWEVSQIADNRFPVVMLLGGLSVNLNHLKNNSNHTTLGATNRKSHDDVPRFGPAEDFVILTLHTLRASLDAPLISFLTSQPTTRRAAAHQKKIHDVSIYDKTVNCKNSQNVAFGR